MDAAALPPKKKIGTERCFYVSTQQDLPSSDKPKATMEIRDMAKGFRPFAGMTRIRF